MRERNAVSADGTRIRYMTRGAGQHVAIVPGTLTPAALFQPLAGLLGDQFQIHLVERRGYGGTETGPGPCRFADQVADLAAVVDDIGQPVALFGHSVGGVVGAALALNSPDKVNSLVLYEPPVSLIGDKLVRMLRACKEMIEANQPEDAVREAFRVSGAPGFDDGVPPARVISMLVPSVPGLAADVECATTMRMPDWASLTAPVLVLQGELTTAEYARSVAMMRDFLPTADFRVLPGTAHFPHDMDQVAKIIADRVG